jgi:Na+/proline symporter
MKPTTILIFFVCYFIVLFAISFFMNKKSGSSNDTFFKANGKSPWYLVAFGMIGTALSGVTFISVPGAVASNQFAYFQFIIGNAIGFIIVATVLLPLYYRLNLTSIYTYIEQRLGYYSYKTASAIFLLSRTIGSAFRLYLVVFVLQYFVFEKFGIPFSVTVFLSLALIFAYTYKGGLKTIIITDTLQTFFLVSSVFFTIYFVCDSLDLGISSAFNAINESQYSQILFVENFLGSGQHAIKQVLGGVFVTIAMVGLDQDLMQKNLSCKNIKEAQKNMFTFTGVFVIINLFFLSVGALLYLYSAKYSINVPIVNDVPRADLLFPEIAFNHFALIPAILFLLGLTAATFATTDSALTALTTSFCIDFLGMEKKEQTEKTVSTRHLVHIGFSILMFVVIMIFQVINDESVVKMIFKVASYTYGPLLGLFAFGILVKNRSVTDKLVPLICLISPAITYFISINSGIEIDITKPAKLIPYQFAEELIIINGLITFIGLIAISQKQEVKETN